MGYRMKDGKEICTNTVSLLDVVLQGQYAKRQKLEEAEKPIKFVSPVIELSNRRGIKEVEQAYNAYTNKVTNIFKGGEWAGRRCFIIGGGESLKGFDFSILRNELTIGVNRVFEVFSPSILYSMDTRFFHWVVDWNLDKYDKSPVRQKFLDYKGITIFLCPLTYYNFRCIEQFYIVKRILDKCISFDLCNGIYGGNNSGFGALMLAFALNANPIYLLGFDMKIEQSSHWHSGYPNQDIEGLRKKLDSYRELLTEFAPLIRRLNLKVVNLYSNSGLQCFEFATIDNVMSKICRLNNGGYVKLL